MDRDRTTRGGRPGRLLPRMRHWLTDLENVHCHYGELTCPISSPARTVANTLGAPQPPRPSVAGQAAHCNPLRGPGPWQLRQAVQPSRSV